MRQVGGLVDRLAVQAEDHIAHLQAALGRRTVFHQLRHQRAGRLVEAEGLGEILVHFLDHHTQPAAADLAGFLQLVGDVQRDIDRDGEGQAHEAAGTGEDLRVDADHFALQVQQRTAGVARVDRHVGLDEGYVALVRQATPLGTDDTGGDRVIEAERRTDGQDPFAHFQLVRIAQFQGRQVLRLDLQHRHVAARVRADQLGLVLATVGQAHQDLVGIGHDVIVGEDVAVVGDDEAGAQRLRLALLAARIARNLRDAALEEVAEHRRQPFEVGDRQLPARHGAIRQLLPRTDIHHRRRRLFDQRREVRQFCPGRHRQAQGQQGHHRSHTAF